MLIKIKKSEFFKFFFILGFIFCLAYNFYLGIAEIPVYFITLIFFIFFTLILCSNIFISSVISWSKTIIFKIFAFLFFWIILGIIVSYNSATLNIGEVLRALIGGFIFSIFLPYIFAYFGSSKIFTIEGIARVIFFIFLLLYTIGIIEFFSALFNVSFVKSIMEVVRPSRILFIHGFPRIMSLFKEPSHYAEFLVLSLPISYSLCFSRHKFIKYSKLDFILKKLAFGFMVFNLIATQSPIFVILFIIIILIYLIKKYVKTTLVSLILNLNLVCLIGIVLLMGVLENFNIDLTTTFLNRAGIAINCILKDPLALVYLEPSLATRIIVFTGDLSIFQKNPIFGVGYGNLTSEIVQYILNSNLPLTVELQKRMFMEGPAGITSSILFRYLAETGMVGTFLLYSIFFSLLNGLNKKLKYYHGLEKEFLTGMKYFLIILIFLSWYCANVHLPILWVLMGIINAAIIYKPKKINYINKNHLLTGDN